MMPAAVFAPDQILEHSPFGVAVFNYNGDYESVNPTYCAIYGYTREELIGKSITNIFPPDRHGLMLGLHQKFLDEGGAFNGEWEVVRRDQSRLQVICESVMVVGDDGQKRRLAFVMDITNRKQLEQALQDSEERLSLVMLGTEDGYFDADLVSGRRSYSSRWWEMLGYEPDAWPLDGQHWQMLTHPDDLERVKSAMASALAGTRDRFEVNVRLRHKDGHYRNMLTRTYIGRDAQGRAVRLTGANTDLTERIRFEQEAKHFQSIVQSSDDAIISKSLDSVVTSWNAGASAMFGYSAREIVGRPISVLLPLDRQKEEEQIMQRIRAGQKVQHFETKRLHRDGHAIDVSVTISPIRDAQGQVIGASKIARDISEKKALEAQLLLTANVFSNTNEGIVVIDAHGQVVEVNPAFTDITGYRREDLLGKASQPLMQLHGMAEMQDTVTEALGRRGHYQGEHWTRRKDLQRIALLITVSAVRTSSGAIQNYVVLLSDITPLRERQDRLEHLAHHDQLTDLPNRVLLADRIEQALILSRRRGGKVAVLYLDLDGFKQVNDQFGHAAGDVLLVTLSQRMKEALREVDTLARIGGDEFAAVLSDIDGLDECQPVLQRLLSACYTPVSIGDKQVQVSVSIGIAIHADTDTTAHQLLNHADRAMYLAKQSGKNQYWLFGT